MTMPLIVEETPVVKAIVATVCAYETAAITTGVVPTLTSIHRKHPTVGVVIVAALVWHFLPPKGA